MSGDSCFSFLSMLFCVNPRRTGSTKSSNSHKVKIRVGFDGKDTYMDTTNMNVKSKFGTFAVLLDYTTNEVVPLNGAGFLVEPLDPHRKYVVVVNTHGSSPQRWEHLRVGDKHGRKHKHHSKSKSKSKKKRSKSKDREKEKEKEKEKKEKGGEMDSMAALSTKDIAITSSSTLLADGSPNNGDEDM